MTSMRIIAGTKKGMTLLSPKGTDTRPITDRVKESVFNILFSKGFPAGCATADLFCGTGSMGLEALSRGAVWATFIDRDFGAVEILNKNIAKSGFDCQCRAICANALKVGAPAVSEHSLYDLVFVDPPYDMSRSCGQGTLIGKLMAIIRGQVRQGGVVVLRIHRKADIDGRYGLLAEIDRRTWGNMTVAFFRREGDESTTLQAQSPEHGHINEQIEADNE